MNPHFSTRGDFFSPKYFMRLPMKEYKKEQKRIFYTI